MERRSFIGSLMGGIAGTFAAISFPQVALAKKAEAFGDGDGEEEVTPIVISAWTYGLKANANAFKVLANGGTSLDAVEQGIRAMEADPNEPCAGIGALPDRKGKVTLEASIMDHELNVGSVAGLENILHPVSVARALMQKTNGNALVGEGALDFALSKGHVRINLLTQKADLEWQSWLNDKNYKRSPDFSHIDTVGTLALDKFGNMSGATSSGGVAFKEPQSICDSAVIGAGLFVDNEIGAAVATGGSGEAMRMAGAHLVVELMRQGKNPEDACMEAVERVFTYRGDKLDNTSNIAFIAMNKKGIYGGFSLQAGFSFAVQHAEGRFLVHCRSLM